MRGSVMVTVGMMVMVMMMVRVRGEGAMVSRHFKGDVFSMDGKQGWRGREGQKMFAESLL